MSVVIVVECMKLHLLYSEELQQVTSLYLKVVFYITSIWFVWAAGFINHGDANTDANEPFARRIQTSKTVYLNQGNGRLNQAKQRQAIQYNWIKPH